MPIQPLSNYNWPPPEEDPHDLFPDEQNYPEVQDSDNYDQQPLGTEVKEIEIMNSEGILCSHICTQALANLS
jgi:hypothetical protein